MTVGRNWDEKEKRKDKEPTGAFYGFCYGIGVGCTVGVILTLVFLLGN